jgi:peptidyl-prolyl cis-trans isomerase SurA
VRLRTVILALLISCDQGEGLSAASGVVPAPAEVDLDAVEVLEGDRVRVRHILLAWAGASRASPELRRSREEAWLEVSEALARLRAGEDFAELAQEFSDDPSAAKGGDLGAIDGGQLNPIFEGVAFSLEEGEVSPIIETPFGFHIIKREPLIEIQIRQVLLQWEGSRKSKVHWSKDIARKRAEDALSRIQEGEDVAAIAVEYSDGPAGIRGGDLGFFQPGQMLAQFEEVAFELEPGQVSAIVESELGFHILYREE